MVTQTRQTMKASEARKIAQAAQNEAPVISEFLCLVEVRAAAKEGKNVVWVKGNVYPEVKNSLMDKGYQIGTSIDRPNETQIIW